MIANKIVLMIAAPALFVAAFALGRLTAPTPTPVTETKEYRACLAAVMRVGSLNAKYRIQLNALNAPDPPQ